MSGRPTEQTVKCLRRDYDWLSRIRKRARDNESRSPQEYEEVIGSLTRVMKIMEKELDEDARQQRQANGASKRSIKARA